VWYQTAAEHAEKLKALDIAVAEECARRSSAALEGLGASLTAEAPGTAGPWSPRHDPAAGRTGFPLPPRQLERMLRPEGPGDRTLDSSTGYRRKQP
jgi:hypothetical protein